MIAYKSLHPGPPSKWVCPMFYGGHLDGEVGKVMESSSLKGKIVCSAGTYQLQGFRSSAQGVSDSLKKFAMDYAVYEWEPRT